MRGSVFFAFVALASLTACQEQVKCDSEGRIVIPKGASYEDRRKWSQENLDLALRQLEVATGSSARAYTRESLEKAPSCP